MGPRLSGIRASLSRERSSWILDSALVAFWLLLGIGGIVISGLWQGLALAFGAVLIYVVAAREYGRGSETPRESS